MTDLYIVLQDYELKDQNETLLKLKEQTIFGKEINFIQDYNRPTYIDQQLEEIKRNPTKGHCSRICSVCNKIKKFDGDCKCGFMAGEKTIISSVNLNEQADNIVNDFFTTHPKQPLTNISDNTIFGEDKKTMNLNEEYKNKLVQLELF